MEATIKEVRLHTCEFLAAIDRGEEIVITHHGRKRARLVPIAIRCSDSGATRPNR